ncbi:MULTISPECIES: hypothetical protein [Paenibacillus]|nr:MULTISPECIES: hypothetical protein [Paenibacillus]MXO77186.1 hypothetical protein [Paenibacillus sp. OT2-17]
MQDFLDLRGFERDVVKEAGVFADKTSPVTEMLYHSIYVLIRNTNNEAI